jgi:hypothetical protein
MLVIARLVRTDFAIEPYGARLDELAASQHQPQHPSDSATSS